MTELRGGLARLRRDTAPRVRVTRPDPWLLVAVAGLVAIGLVMVLDATYFFAQRKNGDAMYFFWKQVVALGLASTLLYGASHLDPRKLERYAPLILAAAAFVLVLLLAVGIRRGGAQRWFSLLYFNIQPSEFAKIAVIIYLARALSRHRDRLHDFVRGLAPHLAVIGIVAGLIGAQPNFSTAAILVLVTGTMCFVAGARIWHLGVLASIAGSVGFYEIWTSEYRWRRIEAVWDPFLDPLGKGFQLIQSLIGFASGGWTGMGMGASRQKMFFLPEAHTDFIFSVIGESYGVIGVAVVLGLFIAVAARGFRIAYRHTDPFSSLLAFGLTLMILLQVVLNVGVAVGMLPTTGLALPFISYGGSALLGAMVEMGLLVSLSRATG